MVRQLLLSLLGICTVIYSAFALWDYLQFTEWDTKVPLQAIKWEIISKDVDSHTFKANYSYHFNGKDYHKAYVFKKPVFVNLLGAEHALNDFSKDYTTTWISLNHPESSSLQKTYPLKELISTGILWVIFCYFLLLPLFANRF